MAELNQFLPFDRSLQRTVLLWHFCLSVRLSDCPSVRQTCVYCDKTKQSSVYINTIR